MMIDILKKSRITLCRLLEITLILAVSALVIVVLWGVFTRYVLSEQAKWSEELARFLLVWVSLLGGAVAFGEKAHLGVDFVVGKFDPAAGKVAAVFGQLVILFFAVTIFIIGGTSIVTSNMEQVAPALGKYGIKMGHVYMALPISGVFMILFTLEQLLETLITTPQMQVQRAVDSLQKEDN